MNLTVTNNKQLKIPFFISYKALEIFIFIVIFQPKDWTFLAVRPSDLWLIFCLFQQDYNGYSQILSFKGRNFILYYGLIMGIIAIVGTTAQTFYDSRPFQLVFFFHIYRFFRFVLIFKLIENVVLYNGLIKIENFFKAYLIIGSIIVILSFFEFYAIQPYQKILINLYYQLPLYTISDYIIKVERLSGILGNSNATAVLLTTLMMHPIIFLFTPNNNLFKKILYSAFIFVSLFIILTMSGSRTAVLSVIAAVIIFVLSSQSRIRMILLPIFITFFLFYISYSIYGKYLPNIEYQERILNVFMAKNSEGNKINSSVNGLEKITGRSELWNNRIKTFSEHGNPTSLFWGLGYTKIYEDYSDDGFLSSFINNGISGLFLKLYLFYLIFILGVKNGIYLFRKNNIYMVIPLVLIVTIFLMSEITMDIMENYKLGQVFYLFTSLLILNNIKVKEHIRK